MYEVLLFKTCFGISYDTCTFLYFLEGSDVGISSLTTGGIGVKVGVISKCTNVGDRSGLSGCDLSGSSQDGLNVGAGGSRANRVQAGVPSENGAVNESLEGLGGGAELRSGLGKSLGCGSTGRILGGVRVGAIKSNVLPGGSQTGVRLSSRVGLDELIGSRGAACVKAISGLESLGDKSIQSSISSR